MTTLERLVEPHTLAGPARGMFLPALANKFMALETAIYNLASEYSEDYTGGFWQFVELPHGDHAVRFMYPERPDRLRVVNPDNYFEGTLDPISFGIGITLIALSRLSFYTPHDSRPTNAYHTLYDWLGSVGDGTIDPALYSFID